MNESENWWQGLSEREKIKIWRRYGSSSIYQDFEKSFYLKKLVFPKIFMNIGSDGTKTRLN